jgi:hypothetical protein
VAYFLNLLNSKAKITEIKLAEVNKFIKQRILDHQRAFEQFFDFRNHEGSFVDTAIA